MRAQSGAGQNIVDAQPALAPKGQVAVVPPAEAAIGLLKAAEGIDQTHIQQRLQMRTLFAGVVDGFGQGDRVVSIAVVVGDVEVTQQGQARMRCQLLRHILLQAIEPAHFVGELVTARLLAIDKITVDDAHAVHRSGNQARVFIGKVWVAAHHILQRQPADEGHAVIGFLPKGGALVAQLGKSGVRKFFIHHLQLLHAQDIDLRARQPI